LVNFSLDPMLDEGKKEPGLVAAKDVHTAGVEARFDCSGI
jgi:hypothetical protein